MKKFIKWLMGANAKDERNKKTQQILKAGNDVLEKHHKTFQDLARYDRGEKVIN